LKRRDHFLYYYSLL